MKKDSFKKLGIVGVSFALMASPLAFADMHNEDEPKTGTTQETDLNDDQGSMNSSQTGGEGQEVTIGNGDDEPKTGTRQETDLDEEHGSMNSTTGEGEETIPGTGAESEPDSGTRGQPDTDEE